MYLFNFFYSYSRQAGHRFGSQVHRTAPLIIEHAAVGDEELSENSLQALEAFVLKCPKEVTPHISCVRILFFIILCYLIC